MYIFGGIWFLVNKIILEIQWSHLMKKVFSKDKLVDKISFNLKDNDLIFSLFNELVILIFYLNNAITFRPWLWIIFSPFVIV